MVPRHLVTILPGENHQHQQNLSSVQPWLLRNVDSGSSQAMHSKQRQTTDSHRFPQKQEENFTKFIYPSAFLNPNNSTCMCYTHTAIPPPLQYVREDLNHLWWTSAHIAPSIWQSDLHEPLVIDANLLQIICLRQTVPNSLLFHAFDTKWEGEIII